MSLMREGLRTAIRTLAFPVMLIYVLYKMYLQIQSKPGTKKLIEAYKGLWTWIKQKIKTASSTDKNDYKDPWQYDT